MHNMKWGANKRIFEFNRKKNCNVFSPLHNSNSHQVYSSSPSSRVLPLGNIMYTFCRGQPEWISNYDFRKSCVKTLACHPHTSLSTSSSIYIYHAVSVILLIGLWITCKLSKFLAGVPNDEEDIEVGVNCENGMFCMFALICGVVAPMLEFGVMPPTLPKLLLMDALWCDGDTAFSWPNELPKP